MRRLSSQPALSWHQWAHTKNTNKERLQIKKIAKHLMTVGSAMAPDSHDQFHREEKNQWAFVGTWVLVPVQVF